ncbi:hypothetical protein B0J11DRAFT_397814, partial [Dendryphion nanum]
MTDSALNRLYHSPRNNETEALIRYLFTKPGVNPQNIDMTKVSDVLRGVQRNYRVEKVAGPTDVVIYCDDSRFRKVKGEKQDIFEETRRGTHSKTKRLLKKIKSWLSSLLEDIGDNLALAVTIDPETSWSTRFRRLRVDPQFSTQIQLCPWFVDWIKSKEYIMADDVRKRTKIGRLVVRAAASNIGFTEIDAYALLDKVLLHEMTHGRHVWRQ